MKVCAQILHFSFPMLVVFWAALTMVYFQEQVVSEPPTNLIIEAAEQNKDCKIAEIEELLDDRWLHRGHIFSCCYAGPYRCIDCGISESEYEEQYFKAWLELHPGPRGFGMYPGILENLTRNVSDLAWVWLFYPYANIWISTVSSLFVLIVVRKVSSKGSNRISTATLGLALGVSLFIVGLVLGPLFACPAELLRTRSLLQEELTVLAPIWDVLWMN